MKLTLREASINDAELLLNWVNDSMVRRNSFCEHEITRQEHITWLSKKLQDSACHIYIAEDNQISVGQVRLDVEGNTAEIDYSIESPSRGKGYATLMIKEAEKLAEKYAEELCAKVKCENGASIRVFEKCGFTKAAETETFVEFRKVLKRRIVICTHKSWNVENAEKFADLYKQDFEVMILTKKEELTKETLEDFAPEYVFIPHWSYIIPESVYGNFICVVFHMTELPFGRGGSPLQNLIVRGFTRTKISAIHVEKGLDTGDIFCQEELDLSGSAEEILKRTSQIIFTKMIPRFLKEKLEPRKQQGEVVTFKRRKPEDGELVPEMNLKTMYDYIRMLDAEGYPNAFIKFGEYSLKFSDASIQDGKLIAKVEFAEREEEKA